MKKLLSCLMMLLTLLSLSACGKEAEPDQEKTGYILTNYAALPDSVTGITRCVLDGDRLLLCCREEEDRENVVTYAAAIKLDGSGFEKLSLPLGEAEKLLDLTPDGQGGLWFVSVTPAEEGGGRYTLCHFDSGGTLIFKTPLNQLMAKNTLGAYRSHYYPFYSDYSLITDGDGNLCFTVRGGTSCLLLDPEGNFLFALQDKGNPKTVIRTPSGQLAICSTDDGDWTYSVRPLDMKKRTLDEGVNLGSISMVYGGAGDTDYYLYDSSDFYRCSLETGVEEKLFNWSNLGLASGDAHVCPLGDGRFAVVAGAFSQTQLLSYEFCIVEPGVDERTVLTMLSLQPDSSLLEAIAQFNKSNDQYRVELSSYFAMNEEISREDWDKAVTRLNTELISGKIPDLMDLNYMPADAYSRRGILENLYPYLENDPGIHMEDYFDNVFTALSIDGKLPYVASNVKVLTILAPVEIVGTKRGWTMEEYISLLNSGEIFEDIYSWTNPCAFLLYILATDPRFVNWETGQCSFDSEEFMQLLETGSALVKSETQNALQRDSDAGTPANCLGVTLFSVFDTALYNAKLGGKAVPIGYPSVSGEAAHILEPANKIGFSSACEHKDGAWAFVRSFLEPKLQESGLFFPFYKPSFEKLAAAAAKGNSLWSTGAMFGDLTIRPEDIALAQELLSTAKYCNNSDQGLLDIIDSQFGLYMTESITAQEAAAAIQSRAVLYVGEHM